MNEHLINSKNNNLPNDGKISCCSAKVNANFMFW